MNDMNTPNNNQPRRGRKSASNNICIYPVFRKEPDIEKLGRAIIALAMRNIQVGNEQAEQEEDKF